MLLTGTSHQNRTVVTKFLCLLSFEWTIINTALIIVGHWLWNSLFKHMFSSHNSLYSVVCCHYQPNIEDDQLPVVEVSSHFFAWNPVKVS